MKIASGSIQSLLLEPRFAGISLATATGFVVVYKDKPFLITNWHVVSGRDPVSGKAKDEDGSLPDHLRIFHNDSAGLPGWVWRNESLVGEDGVPLWYEHPKWRRSCDVVALPLTSTEGVQLYPHNLVTNPDIAYRVTSDVSIVGFPFGITGGAGGLAVWSTGTLATEPQVDYATAPLMLIDSRTRQGQSGSPVLFYMPPGGLIQTKTGAVMASGVVCELLGVYSGRINEQSDLGLVWKTTALLEILENGVPGNCDFKDPAAPAFPITS